MDVVIRTAGSNHEQVTSASLAGRIMAEFARLTGLSPASGAPRRYLWTDAFAVCNFLGLLRETRNEDARELALQLVDQVHSVLGRHRNDDSRTGWTSGLDEEHGRLHPTRGGLRIGKPLNERRPGDPLDERLEWDRDGQYYHYLTKWMHALNRVTTVTGDFTYNRWATDLARTAHSKFVYAASPGRRKRMYWKMTIDLSYPLVSSMGLHDPLDGLITYSQLQSTADEDPGQSSVNLRDEIADMASLCEGKRWATEDPLGIGGLLSDAFRVAQLMVRNHVIQTGLLASLLEASLVGLETFTREHTLGFSADTRLAFRELGLSIGLQAVPRLSELVDRNEQTFRRERNLKQRVNALKQYEVLSDTIMGFWLHPEYQEAESWMEHREINMVMIATSLSPGGYLSL